MSLSPYTLVVSCDREKSKIVKSVIAHANLDEIAVIRAEKN